MMTHQRYTDTIGQFAVNEVIWEPFQVSAGFLHLAKFAKRNTRRLYCSATDDRILQKLWLTPTTHSGLPPSASNT